MYVWFVPINEYMNTTYMYVPGQCLKYRGITAHWPNGQW